MTMGEGRKGEDDGGGYEKDFYLNIDIYTFGSTGSQVQHAGPSVVAGGIQFPDQGLNHTSCTEEEMVGEGIENKGEGEDGGKRERRGEQMEGEGTPRDRASATRFHPYGHFVSAKCFVKPVYRFQHVGY